ILVAVAFLAGWRTRMTTLLLWFLFLSLDKQAPTLINRGDILMRLLLLWSVFLPLGARYSLDERRAQVKTHHFPTRFVGVASAGILLQITCMYFFTALLKAGPAWHSNFDALSMALRNKEFSNSIGQALAEWTQLTTILTRMTYWLELLIPLGLFFPWKTALIRIITVI